MMYQAPQPRPVVLIAEDEVLVRMYAADVLAEHGFDVLEAGNADEALGRLNAGARIDVLFTDVNMPGDLDGIELARLVRARCPDTEILITSGREGSGIDRGLGRFVPKPYAPEQIANTIRLLLHRRAHCPAA